MPALAPAEFAEAFVTCDLSSAACANAFLELRLGDSAINTANVTATRAAHGQEFDFFIKDLKPLCMDNRSWTERELVPMASQKRFLDSRAY
jgi:hypothetical protein